jgi:hypothetical protein
MKHICRHVIGLLALGALGACSVDAGMRPRPSIVRPENPSDDGLTEDTAYEESSANLELACTPYLGQRCYWMENTSGNSCWVPATGVGSFQGCYAMDSCNGGLGRSGGGCYKWADCSGCARYPW